jgi:predicted  nucleic acid-binding Zn-ribbon protein
MLNTSKILLDKLNKETELITDQNKALDDKTKKAELLETQVKNLEAEEEKLGKTATTGEDTLKDIKNNIETNQIYTYVYIALNAIFLIVMIYLFFSN